ncbi:MAG TPA: hypothetical protein VGI14_13845 [Casimicrobiaceae bacterium]|jgi:hypothetical protein
MLKLPLFATIAIVAALLLYFAAGLVGAQRKLAPLEPIGDARANYQVTLDFAPERFHQLFLQDKGRMVGVHGDVVDMMDVEPGALRDIARQYWVASISRWKGR